MLLLGNNSRLQSYLLDIRQELTLSLECPCRTRASYLTLPSASNLTGRVEEEPYEKEHNFD